MGRKKHPFIDKKKAITFRLVNRSQQDPLVADETAPQHVLVPIRKNKAEEPSTSHDANVPPEKRRKEQQKFGIFFDDDYDYLQHLREPGRAPDVYWEEVPHKHADEAAKPKIQLPSSVFASEFEEEEGLLRKAAPRSGPRLDWDPEIVEALDDDFNFEDPDNELDDDFMEKAMGGEDGDDDDDEWMEDEEESDVDSNAAGYSDEEDDDVGPLPRNFAKFDGEDENKSRFTEYSMSSSVIRRNEQLTLLDDRFEKFYEDYDDPEVGALDCEEIEGHVDIDNELLLECAQEFKKKELPQKYDKAWDVCRLVKMQHVEDAEEEIVALEVSDDEDAEGKRKKKWDCESILSTYSNIYNHPKVIDVPSKRQAKIQINAKTGLPMDVLDGDEKGKLTRKALAKLEIEEKQSTAGPKSLCAESVLSTLSVLSIRPKDETPEERRERKKLLKEYKQERRIEKKINKIAFNDERLRQHTIEMNNKNNMQGNKIV